ncbi:kinesin-domain-containing protein [Durotheca rogersii]|uniref:kinesin-domain-containing protein n=1 Tax=Durotheca rogersii TaxID=419775 RepID=UPI002220DFE7|nr:kinesin-domain-containing protein [Durotheca rogersii]KAI5865710.1 kinesin-domain-containing protein [Durotheca rogersii]
MSTTDPGASSITVTVRVRPFTIREAAQLQKNDDGTLFLGDGSLAAAPTPKLKQHGIRSVIKVVDDRCLVFDPPEDSPVHRFSRSVVPNGKKVKDQVFAFDRIFDENTTQTEVYEATTKTLLDSVLDGYNATVFAYGATGCGKTHTITGTAQMPGIIFLTMQELFEKIAERSDEKHTEISLSYLEIYNETIRDLLVPGGSKQGLMLREDSNQAVTVAGLTSHHPRDVQEVMDMIVQGNEYRTVSPTEANATSSRSHAVLQINVAQKDRNAAVSEPHTMATLSIIDLAGSERASATKNRGERLLEGANINKSLLALGSCINALCDARKTNHVPYRNSKLTRLLKFSLGGNCKTVMIVCVSPSSAHFDETQNTLRYANRAKNIQTKVTRNVFNVNRHAQQKDAERTFFIKFQKQMEKRGYSVKEGVQRIRNAYENSLPERQEKVNNMKKLRGIERRIGLLSSWIASFDAVCDAREDEGAMPSNLVAMRKTAQGILLELENSRYHIHQKLDRANWERAIDGALQHSISQLPAGDGYADNGEIDSLTREAELLKCKFAREADREVLEQDKVGDTATMQVLLTAQFETLASLSETISMSEEEAVAHAKSIINRLLETGYAATSQVVKPDGVKMPVEAFPPTKRGTPKRKKISLLGREPIKPIPIPALSAIAESEAEQLLSPVRGSPRRRKALNARKGVSFTPVKKRSPSKRAVRWRDDDGETLADFEKTPKRFESSPDRASPGRAIPRFNPIPFSPIKNRVAVEEPSPPVTAPEATSSLPVAKPNRFQAGFLSKSRSPDARASPTPPTISINLTSPEPEEKPSPLRNLDVSRTANIGSPGSTRRASFSPKAAAATASSSIPAPVQASSLSTTTFRSSSSSSDENHPPSSDDSETSNFIDASKLRSALHASKRPKRLSMLAGSVGAAGSAGARRVSSIGSFGGSHKAGNGAGYYGHSYHHHSAPLASSTNGISRNRRSSSERRRSPPISCSPPDLGGPGSGASAFKAFTLGQARRMNLAGSLRGGAGSSVLQAAGATQSDGERGRRITIGGAAVTAGGVGVGGDARRGEKGAVVWR